MDSKPTQFAQGCILARQPSALAAPLAQPAHHLLLATKPRYGVLTTKTLAVWPLACGLVQD